MLKKIMKMTACLILLAALAFICWLMIIQFSWPDWYAPLLFVCVIIGTVALRWSGRWIYTLIQHMRLRLKSATPSAKSQPDIDVLWSRGVRYLRKSRLGRLSSALYALPWYVMTDSSNNQLLTHCGLTSQHSSDDSVKTDTLSSPLEWFFFSHTVIIRVSRELITSHTTWHRLLYWLSRTRRREPLNGIIMTIHIPQLLNNEKKQLAELGNDLRQHLDDLVSVFSARIPVYFVLTGGEHLTGMLKWCEGISDELRSCPFGFTYTPHSASGTADFLGAMFDQIADRLNTLRFDMSQHALPDPDVLHFPEQVAALRAPLEKLISPAFDNNPYHEPPLLSGLFITADSKDENGVTTSWFCRELFSSLLSAQRGAYRFTDRWTRWRRLTKHITVITWLVFCGAVAAVLLYSHHITRAGLQAAEQLQMSGKVLGSDITRNIEQLRIFQLNINQMENFSSQRWAHWLPFHHLDDVIKHERAAYVDAFTSGLQEPLFEEILPRNLPFIAGGNNNHLIAAYAEQLVRRINLLDARLAGQRLDDLSGPDYELFFLFQQLIPREIPTLPQLRSLNNSYKAYLSWSNDLSPLRADRNDAFRQLQSMGLADRPLSWLESLAEQHFNIPQVRYSTFLPRANLHDMALPRAYTVEGQNIILKFIDELKAASGEKIDRDKLREQFFSRYLGDVQDAWFRFASGFLLADKQYPVSQTDWQERLAVIATSAEPRHQLLQKMARRFMLIPSQQRSQWATLSIHLNHLLSLTEKKEHDSFLRGLSVTNKIGKEVLKNMLNTESVSDGIDVLKHDVAQVKTLTLFNQLLKQTSETMLKSDAQAFQVAMDNWGYGNDPKIKSASLWEANDLHEKLRREIPLQDNRETLVWELATGGLAFTMQYAGHIAACQLQEAWNGQVIGTTRGVNDPVVLNKLLYGENGQLDHFIRGSAAPFIQRGISGYSPRFALNSRIPLMDIFFVYLNHTQNVRQELASAMNEAQTRQTAVLSEKQTLQAARSALLAQQTALQQKITQLQAISSVVSIQAEPSSVNKNARKRPEQTRLTLQCNTQATSLDNYNFPSAATFAWAPGHCGDVSLEIRFPGYSLEKRWNGERGFINFLQNFSSGQHTFMPDDFPEQRGLMLGDNVTALTLTYLQQGGEELLNNYQQADAAQTQLSSVEEQLQNNAERLAVVDKQSQKEKTGSASEEPEINQEIAAFKPPLQIAECWAEPASAPVSVTDDVSSADLAD